MPDRIDDIRKSAGVDPPRDLLPELALRKLIQRMRHRAAVFSVAKRRRLDWPNASDIDDAVELLEHGADALDKFMETARMLGETKYLQRRLMAEVEAIVEFIDREVAKRR